MARVRERTLEPATHTARIRNCAWSHERMLLSCDLSYSIRDRWGYRVSGPHHARRAGRTDPRNIVALLLAAGGGWLLTDVRFSGQPLGLVFAFANCAFFMLYVVLGHRIAQDGGAAGIDRLGAAMLVALVTITPIGITGALPAMAQPLLLLAGIGVGICSSVIPYVSDQLAMARLPRATFALLLFLLPASAALIGILVLR